MTNESNIEQDSSSPDEEFKPKFHPIANNLSRFVTSIHACSNYFPTLMDSIVIERNDSAMNFFEGLKHYGELIEKTESQNKYRIPANHIYEVTKLRTAYVRSKLAADIIPRSFIVSTVSQFDYFIGRLITGLYELKPELLGGSDRQLSLSDLTKFETIEEAKEFLIEKEIETVLRKSHTDQFKWMENRFSVELRKGLESWSQFIELTERRNLFAHANGIVSSHYLSVCDAHNYQFLERPEVGDELEVDLTAGSIRDKTSGEQLTFSRIPQVMLSILDEGGLVPYIKKHGDFKL